MSASTCEQCEDSEASCACCTDDGGPSEPSIKVAPLRRRGAHLVSSLLPKPARRMDSAETATLQAEKIDFHVHCASGDEAGLAALLRCNRSTGISKAVLLALRNPQATVEDVRRINDWVLSASARHPSEIVPFVTILESDEHAATMLREYVDRGACGLKLIGWTGACIRQFDYDLLGPTMQAVFQTAEACSLPVLIHLYLGIADEDESQRASAGAEHAILGGPYRDYLSELNQLLSAHPGLTLVLAHFGLGFDEKRLPRLHELLARHPNLYLDTSLYGGARVKWFGKASRRAEALAKTVALFPRQVLFGTDNFGSRQRAERVYRDAVRASCLHLACSRFVCPEFQAADATGSAAAAGAREASARMAGSVGRSRVGTAKDDGAALNGLDLQSSPALLRAVLFENASRLLQR